MQAELKPNRCEVAFIQTLRAVKMGLKPPCPQWQFEQIKKHEPKEQEPVSWSVEVVK